ncbi:MAG: L,D-transpeptidase family protein [Rhodothermales bacterium]|nr:L,D-transpeptidase family protein [Rhodothermales bacterium]MBO6780268.1 L,D-transpeptidase family protein [Rhodothermales bacterium]
MVVVIQILRLLLFTQLLGLTPQADPDNWPAAADSAVVRLLETTLEESPGFDAQYPWARPVDEDIQQFYAANAYRAAWMDGPEPTRLAEMLMREIEASEQDGFRPEAFGLTALHEATELVEEDPVPRNAVAAELEFSRAFIQFAGAHLEGRVDPRGLGSEVYLTVPRAQMDSILTEVLSGSPPRSLRTLLVPESPRYENLVDALARYREIADRGGWQPVSDGDELIRPGDLDPRVPALRARLSASGDLASGAMSDSTFDGAIQSALARFQERNGLVVDSTVGPATLAALNTTVEERIRQIEMSMERLRWLPRDLGDRHIFVNIPEFKVYGYDEGRESLEMRVVVGSEYGGRETPVFQDEMDHVVFNPYWNVPRSITMGEILPNVKEDPGYLASRGYEGVDGDGDVVPGAAVTVDDIESGAVRIRQQPGTNNALGQVKYMFPNRHAIYLHDTPADHLFSEAERDFSHGCIRLEDPPGFGEYVLGQEGWGLLDVESAIASNERQVVRLSETIPVYIMYLTAFEDDGLIAFRGDIYDNDRALLTALERYEGQVTASK